MPAALLTCTDFTTLQTGNNPAPLAAGGLKIRAFDFAGAATPTVKVSGTSTGGRVIDCDHRLEIEINSSKVKAVCLSVMTRAQAPEVRFFSAAGNLVGSVTLAATQGVPQEAACVSTSIKRVVIIAPSNETLLLALCAG